MLWEKYFPPEKGGGKKFNKMQIITFSSMPIRGVVGRDYGCGR
jgi:hypothetical protein